MKEFKINEYISIKLEYGKTNIYIKGELFRQCKFLLLFIPTNDKSLLDDINSIDEASKKLNFSLDPDVKYIEPELREIINDIDAETEFWAHCSNLQVWAESNYDTRLLHSNLSFPLLKKLTEEGDPIARRRFKEEIGNRYFTGVESVQIYLEEEGYLEFLSKEEIKSFINSGSDVIDELESILGIDLKITTVNENFSRILIKKGEIVGLDLSHLNLKKLPSCIQKLNHLEMLSLVSNQLDEVPAWIGKLVTLKKLNMVNNEIKSLPESVGKLTSLETLDLAQNELEKLPESIGDLLSLKKLYLYNNQLKELPESIGNLKILETILVGENLLEYLPESIGNLDKLQSLKLGSNPIKSLPTSISELLSLKVLSIRKTLMCKLLSLKELSTSQNKILESLKKKKVKIYI